MSNGHLSGAWNFRDIAETAGVRPGRFFRSSELSNLDDSGRDAFRRLGITDVADLRSPQEVERRGPGAVPDGVAIHLLPFPDLSNTTAEAPHETSWQKMMTEKPDEDVEIAAERFMTEEYQKFPVLGGAQRAVRQVFSLLGSGRPVITHCFAGKDRTGFTVAVVLEAIGVPRDAILADFLRSNDAVPHLRDHILETIRSRTGETPEVMTFAEARLTDGVLGVREDYLATARRTIDENYGDLDGFLRVAGVTTEDVGRVRTQLLG
ncbi:phosphotyrosine protein phosphatase [Mycolicibacterium litorale]|nr:phosphotyrosine protein phosphatase [Mycolicibacterium litorale]